MNVTRYERIKEILKMYTGLIIKIMIKEILAISKLENKYLNLCLFIIFKAYINTALIIDIIKLVTNK